jgi:hypothetical protein
MLSVEGISGLQAGEEVKLQLLIASGALAWARKAAAAAECPSGVSSASSTQVSM